jgi:xanthine dehydrogenase YagS FAD-binding subunit
MRPFAYLRAETASQARSLGRATGAGEVREQTHFLAGGTTLVDLMKLDVLRPEAVVDINPLRDRHAGIEHGGRGLRMGALATMADVADDQTVQRDYPVIAESLKFAASAQLRNMATIGGNLLQRTRCPYFRDTSWQACNKRSPGTGCAALNAPHRNHAVLGTDDSCISQYPGDLAVALIALDAVLEVNGASDMRLEDLHRPASGRPEIEHTLEPGDLITAVVVPIGRRPRSLYLKIRDRASYEFAISSAAVALELDGDRVEEVRIGLGGVAYKPWRAREAEESLKGKRLTEQSAMEAAQAALAGANPRRDNAYKPELSRRTIVRALMEAKSMEVS